MTDFVQDHPDGVLVMLDEMSLQLQATLSRVWFPVGQRPTIKVSPQRDCLHFFGALALPSGQEIALSLPTLDSNAFIHFLNHLLTVFPVQPILLFLDRAPWHKSQAVSAFLADQPRLQLLFFPPACPQLNPQEHVWKAARKAVSHNHSYLSLGALRKAFAHFLDTTLFPFHWLEKFLPISMCHV